MKYADIRLKKVIGMSLIFLILTIVITATAAAWQQDVGTFSIPGVELAFVNGVSSWRYRLEFNWRYGTQAQPGTQSLLAAIGFVPPVASSETLPGPTSTTAQAIPVLLYHGVMPQSNDPEVITTSGFRDQMFALKAAGWQTVSIEDFVAAMQGEKSLPPKSFLLTFDDGRKDAFYNATPILQALGYQAVMHVIAGRSLVPQSSSYYLSTQELQQMLNTGTWELQSHSNIAHVQYPIDASGTLGDFYGHKLWIPTQNPGESTSSYEARVYDDFMRYWITGKLWPLEPGRLETTQEYEARIATDLLDAKNALKDKLGVDAISFAYPYNDFAQDLESDALSTDQSALITFANRIYAVSFYQWYPALGYSEDYPSVGGQLLARIEPRPNWTPDYLLFALQRGQAKVLPYTLQDPTSDGWTGAWGNIATTTTSFTISAKPTTAGAASILDGSRLWKNYNFTAHIDWQNAQSVSLFAHYQADPQRTSYLACNFGVGTVRLENHATDGTITVLAQQSNSSIGPGADDAGISVFANTAQCLWNGGVIAGSNIPSSAPQSGGIGIEVWDHDFGVATLAVNGVSVK